MASTEKKKPVIGLSWEPKLPSLSSAATKSIKSKAIVDRGVTESSSSLWKPNTDLVNGLYVPPNDPRKLNKLLRAQIKDTLGKYWFDMPAQRITPELKKDLQLLKLRSVMDPKRHYKKGDLKSKELPKYFQVGTVIESATEFYSSRLTKKERKGTVADELLADQSLKAYRKRKVREIEEQKRPGGNEKWKIKGKQTQTQTRAKKRRQH